MNANRTLNVSRNIAWGMVNKVVTSVFPFITRTVMIYTIGLSYVGVSSLFSSVFMVLSLSELGIGTAMVYHMYRPMAEQDDEKICALLFLYRKCYYIIGTIILLMGLCLMPFVPYLVNGEVPSDVNLRILFAIFLLDNVLEYFLFGYKRSLLIADQRSDYLSKIGASIQCITNVLKILVLSLSGNYYLYVLILPAATCANNIVISILTKKRYPRYVCRGIVDSKERDSIKKMVAGLFMQKIGGVVNNAVDSIVISMFLGLVTLAMYQNYFVIISTVMGIVATIYSSLTATVGNCIASDRVEDNFKLFNNLNFIYIWIIGWCSICLFCLFQPFISLWLGENHLFSVGMVQLFTAYFFIYKWCDVLGIFQEACGLWWETRWIPIVGAILNLLVNIVLVQIIGLPGILISTNLSIICVYDLGCSIALFQTYFKPIRNGFWKFWKRQTLYLVSIITGGGVTWFVCNQITFESDLAQLFFNAVVCVAVPNLIMFLCWKRCDEMQYMLKKIMNIVKNK